MATEADWNGLVSGRSDSPTRGLYVSACLQPGKGSAASPFLALGSDGAEWWVKPPENAMLLRALVTEQVVAGVGNLIGAPMCQAAKIDIPAALLPWSHGPGRSLVAGLGSATKGLPNAVMEIRGVLDYRAEDDNRARHAGVYALVDWCFGSDLQWLIHVSDEWRLYSHDHGWYFPPSGADWTVDQLRTTVDQPCPITDDASGLSQAELTRLADALDEVKRDDIAGVLRNVPTSWIASDTELETLGWYLETRAPQVAARLRAL